MSKEDIVKFQMKKGETLNPYGRPPKILTAITRELLALGYERVKPSNVIESYEILLGLNEEKLKEVLNDRKLPMILRIVSKAMLSSKGMEMMEIMMSRIHGRPKQSTDITSNGETLSSITVTYIDKLEPNSDQTTQGNTGEGSGI